MPREIITCSAAIAKSGLFDHQEPKTMTERLELKKFCRICRKQRRIRSEMTPYSGVSEAEPLPSSGAFFAKDLGRVQGRKLNG